MFSKIDINDAIALVGFVMLVAGVYLWLGLAASLILTGVVLIYAGARLDLPGRAALETQESAK